MGTLSPLEEAGQRVHPLWLALDPIRAQIEALTKFLQEELPADAQFDIAGMNLAIRLTNEFNEIWPHRVPTRFELVQAEADGTLEQTIQEINDEFARSRA